MEKVYKVLLFHCNCPDNIARILTSLTVFGPGLPQGAPTSPILSNFVTIDLDRKLDLFSEKLGITYSRYADDLTFSFNILKPLMLGKLLNISNNSSVTTGEHLNSILAEEGFEFNQVKTRLQQRHQRQSVTGVVVNEKLNLKRDWYRELRSMIWSWKRYGYASAFKHYCKLKSLNFETLPSNYYAMCIEGKLNYMRMIVGETRPSLLKLEESYYELKYLEPKVSF